jgi:hypothetical protein
VSGCNAQLQAFFSPLAKERHGLRAAAARVVGPAAVLPLGLRGPLRSSCTCQVGGNPPQAEDCRA